MPPISLHLPVAQFENETVADIFHHLPSNHHKLIISISKLILLPLQINNNHPPPTNNNPLHPFIHPPSILQPQQKTHPNKIQEHSRHMLQPQTNTKPTPEQSQNNLHEFNRFLQNNNQLLQEKYKEHFKQDKIKIVQGRDPKVDVVVNFIADVFSFQETGGSDGKSSLGMIRDSLKSSYENFMKRNKQLKQFTVDVAIELLRYCIESNQMFAVQYQATKQAKKQSHPNNTNHQSHPNNQLQQEQPSSNNPNQPHPNPHNPHNNINQFANPSYTDPNNPDTTSNNNNNNSEQNSNSNSNNNYNYNYNHNSNQQKNKNKNSFDDGELLNQFNFHEEIKLDLDPGIVKKNIKIVFDYYCKQQMALAPNLSFDRIERQSHMMTLGKILLMARMMNMVNGVITRPCIINKFRKISQGKKQIDYKKFDILMNQLQIEDPTLLARSEMLSPNIQAYLKTTKKPFDTQDMLPRELIKKRSFNNKLTLHSGKMEADLLQDLKIKKSSLQNNNNNNANLSNISSIGNMDEKLSPKQSRIKMMEYYDEISQKIKQKQKERQKQKEKQRDKDIIKLKQMQYMSSIMRRQSEIIGPKNLKKMQRNHSHDLSLLKIKKIITVEQEDDKWLSQYKINNSIRKAQAYDDNIDKRRSFQDKQRNSVLIRDLKNRVKQMEINQSPSSLDQTKPYLISPTRRY